jgi:hypothetical protein
LNYELFAEQELDKANNFYLPAPSPTYVWLDEAGRQQGNKDCIQQHRCYDNLMREHNQAIKWIIPTPVNTGKDANNDPDM